MHSHCRCNFRYFTLILAVADVVESIASFRPYQPALGIEKALKEFASGKYYEADTGRLFELAKKSRYTGIFSELAESFGMIRKFEKICRTKL
jgi:hypothetical protein